MTSTHTAFWIDYEYDRERASDEVSQFGAHVRRANSMAECWDGTWNDPQVRQARFAEAAWATATPPVMSPGYVRHHRRVIRACVEFNAWNATLTGVVELVTPWLQPLAGARHWQGSARWRDWPTNSYGGVEYYREPGGDERTTHRYFLVSGALVFPLATDGLPTRRTAHATRRARPERRSGRWWRR